MTKQSSTNSANNVSHRAAAWLRAISDWLLATDNDMKLPDGVLDTDPLDLADELELAAKVDSEPFGYWIEQKGTEPFLLRKPAYIPEADDLRTVTPIYSRPGSGKDEGPALAALRSIMREYRDTMGDETAEIRAAEAVLAVADERTIPSTTMTWTTGIEEDGSAYFQDEDFTYDARLYLDGDWPSEETRNAYVSRVLTLLSRENLLIEAKSRLDQAYEYELYFRARINSLRSWVEETLSGKGKSA